MEQTLNTLIARNAESFSFIYQENIDRLGNVSFFDPEKDVPQLAGVDLLYLPGGYPEKHLEALTGNEVCRKAIKEYAERGGRIVAECGGMMYLCNSIISDEGTFPMCGVLPYSVSARKADRKLSLGYRRFCTRRKGISRTRIPLHSVCGQPAQKCRSGVRCQGTPSGNPSDEI